jgi:NADPH:quinone reductase-like Zn-dependent oxidoreductase
VSFFSQSEDGGTWSRHITVNVEDCIAIGDEISDEQAACLSVNPFTAYAMIEQAKQDGSKAIIQNAAAGQIAYFIRALAALDDIEVINIVRKEEQQEALRADGNKYVIFDKSENFIEELATLSRELCATTAFDATGGELSGHILKAMPNHAILYLYGALAGRTLSEIPALDIIFRNKIIRGFNVNEWKDEIGKDKFKMVSEHIQGLIANGKIQTRIQGKFQMKDFGTALMQYIRNMSGGKVLLMPNIG